MKTAVMTLTIGEGRDFAKINHLSFKRYADRIGADFVVYDNFEIPTEYSGVICGRRSEYNVYCKKLIAIYRTLEVYDRIIYLDDSSYISNDCPNVFSIIPENFMGMHNEGMLEFISEVVSKSNNTITKHGLKPVPKKTYFNSGMIVVSKMHQHIFSSKFVADPLLKQLIDCEFVDQTFLNYMINNKQIPYWSMNQLFNKMYVFKNHSLDYVDMSMDDVNKLVYETHDFDFLTKDNTQPGHINHAFIYHFTSMWSNDQRYNLCKRLEEINI